MVKKKKKKILTPEERREIRYNRAVRRMEGAMRMLQAEDRLRMNRQAIRMLEKLGDYKDSRERFQVCQERAPRLRRQYRKSLYDSGLELMEGAKKSSDYQAAAAEFAKLKTPFQDSDQKLQECQRLQSVAFKQEKARNRRMSLLMWAGFAALVCLILFLRTPAAFYQEGKFLMKVHDYERAKNVFRSCDGYKDTAILAQECYYQRAFQYDEMGKTGKAIRVLQTKVGDYKDALEVKAGLELKVLQAAGTGDSLVYGNADWLVADIDQKAGKYLLVMKEPLALQTAFQSGGGEASWESSDMRKWLNSSFLQDNFSEPERKQIDVTELKAEENSLYHTKDASGTADQVFCLDQKEFLQYKSLLARKDNQYSWWLRTPGAEKNSFAYVTADGQVVAYGNTAGAKELAVRPAMWVELGQAE